MTALPAPIAQGVVYAGRTREGNRVTVHWEVSPCQNAGWHQTVEHEPVPENAVTLSVTYEEVDPRRTRNRDKGVVACGAGVADALRDVHNDTGSLDREQRDQLAAIAKRWHLSEMQAGCAHMPGWDELTELATAAGAEQRYGKPDVAGWAIRNVACERSGYTWGSAWLVDPLPDEVQRELLELTAAATASER